MPLPSSSLPPPFLLPHPFLSTMATATATATAFNLYPSTSYNCIYSFVGCTCTGCGIHLTDHEEFVLSYEDVWYCCSECLYESVHTDESEAPIDEEMLNAALDEDYDW